MDEETFLEEPGANISSSRVVIDGKTFATRNIGSLDLRRARGPGFAPFLFFFAALVAYNAQSVTWTAVLAAAGIYLLWRRIVERTLVIVAGGGETVAVRTTNGARAQRIHDAVARAIATR